MPKSTATGLTRIIRAAGYSIKGLKAAFRHEAAFREEAILFVILIPVAIWLGRSIYDYILLIGSLLLVLIIELLNSSIEAVVDRVGSEIHKLAGRAKDMGSAAVFFSLVNAFLVWGLIAFDRFSN